MNREQLRRSIGKVVQLEPIACRLDGNGIELPMINDDWRIQEAMENGIRIDNMRTGHTMILANDHIHHFTSNPDRDRGGQEFGFLSLHVQVFIQGQNIEIRPNGRPGERVAPPIVEVIEQVVDINYPAVSGLQRRLEEAGYGVQWCAEPRVPGKCEAEGWEIVIERNARGILSKFRVRTRPHDQILIKRVRN